jgi:FhuF 2Fe-2S C-terminal domain
VPASAIRDPGWLGVQLDATARRYRLDRRAAVGVLWWYSASSVLLGPPVSSVVRGEPVAGASLDELVLYLHPDGRVLDARSTEAVGDTGKLAGALAEAVAAVAKASGAPEPTLWAIATDSLANQVLWAGGAPETAVELARSIGSLPEPRYVSVHGRPVVRRASCCLIYQAPGQEKCMSCPRQHPDDRYRRLRGWQPVDG